jgi:hypothetical protein
MKLALTAARPDSPTLETLSRTSGPRQRRAGLRRHLAAALDWVIVGDATGCGCNRMRARALAW